MILSNNHKSKFEPHFLITRDFPLIINLLAWSDVVIILLDMNHIECCVTLGCRKLMVDPDEMRFTLGYSQLPIYCVAVLFLSKIQKKENESSVTDMIKTYTKDKCNEGECQDCVIDGLVNGRLKSDSPKLICPRLIRMRNG